MSDLRDTVTLRTLDRKGQKSVAHPSRSPVSVVSRRPGLVRLDTGDLSLALGEGRAENVRRGTRPARTSGLRLDPGAEAWKGFPVVRAADEQTTVWLLGELYGCGICPALLAGVEEPERDSDDALAETLLRTARGDIDAGHLNGHFLLVARDHESGCWTVVTDRFGTIHAYLRQEDSGLVLSTSFAIAAGEGRTASLDWPAISGFLQLGYFPADRTWLDDVRMLRPATRITFDQRGRLLSEHRTWDWPKRPERYKSSDKNALIERFAETLRIVLEEHCAQGRIAVPISGGLDSRSTVVAIPQEQWESGRLKAYSYGWGQDSKELAIAREIAAARQLPFDAWQVPANLLKNIHDVHLATEGFQDVTLPRQSSLIQPISGLGDFVVAAHWGDVWLNDQGYGDESDRSVNSLVGHVLSKTVRPGSDWLHKTLCAHRLSEGGISPNSEPSAPLQGIVAQELGRFDHIESPELALLAHKTEQWSHRFTLASLRTFQAAVWPRLTFYDHRLTDLLVQIPAAMRAGRELQVEYIKRYGSDLGRIRWQAYDADLWSYRHFNTLLLPKRLLNRFKRTQRDHKSPIIRNWEHQLQGRRAALEEHLLGANSVLAEFASPDAVLELLHRLESAPDAATGHAVSMLLTFSLAISQLTNSLELS